MKLQPNIIEQHHKLVILQNTTPIQMNVFP